MPLRIVLADSGISTGLVGYNFQLQIQGLQVVVYNQPLHQMDCFLFWAIRNIQCKFGISISYHFGDISNSALNIAGSYPYTKVTQLFMWGHEECMFQIWCIHLRLF